MAVHLSQRVVSPGSVLENLPRAGSGGLILITGPMGAGKTTWCLQLSSAARERGFSPVGLVSPAVFENGRKTGIDLLDVSSGESRRLAGARDARTCSRASGPVTKAWQFDREVFAWGNRLLSGIQNAGLLLIDELGPLEFHSGEGLQAAFPVLDARGYTLACVVVRPSLIDRALERWPWARVVEVREGGF